MVLNIKVRSNPKKQKFWEVHFTRVKFVLQFYTTFLSRFNDGCTDTRYQAHFNPHLSNRQKPKKWMYVIFFWNCSRVLDVSASQGSLSLTHSLTKMGYFDNLRMFRYLKYWLALPKFSTWAQVFGSKQDTSYHIKYHIVTNSCR